MRDNDPLTRAKQAPSKGGDLVPFRFESVYAIARKRYVQGEVAAGERYYPSLEDLSSTMNLPLNELRTKCEMEEWNKAREFLASTHNVQYGKTLAEEMQAVAKDMAVEAADSTGRHIHIWKMFEEEILHRLESGETRHLDPKELELLIRSFKNVSEGIRLVVGKTTQNIGVGMHLENADPEELRQVLVLGGQIAQAMADEGVLLAEVDEETPP